MTRRQFVRKLTTWSPERWIALGALGISLCSLTVSLVERHDARGREKLLVRPRFAYTYSYDQTGAGWRLSNTGLGPARLRGFKMLVDGARQNDLIDLLGALGIGRGTPFRFSNPLVGEQYKAGLENVLIWIQPSPAADQLREAWTRVTFEACYCSIYDECWVFSSADLPGPDGQDRRDDTCSVFKGQEHNRWWMG